MAQRTNRPSSTTKPGSGRGGAPAGSRRRTPAPPVKKPFPWGVVATSAVLGLLLLGIIAYAATNQGSGFVTALKRADATVPGVRVFDNEPRNHVPGTVKYPQTPPVGGNHNALPQTCQVYSQPVANEHVVHSLEHGAVWITYRPDLPAAELSQLTKLVKGNDYRLLSPFPGLTSPITLQAWGRQIAAQNASDPKVEKFLNAYTSGPQSPERGSACAGTTATGPLLQAPQVAPSASVPSANPAPSASKK